MARLHWTLIEPKPIIDMFHVKQRDTIMEIIRKATIILMKFAFLKKMKMSESMFWFCSLEIELP